MKLGKGKGKQIRKFLYNYFKPMHEHLGFENAISLYKIKDDVLKKIDILNGHKKNCPYFQELFIDYLGSIIHFSILNPKSKEWYLRGLLCEPISESKQHRVGYELSSL